MNVAVTKTRAEQTLGEHFAEVAPRLPGEGWLRKLRADAMGAFAARGLPHRRIEEWKYTDLRERWRDAAEPAVGDRTPVRAEELEAALGPLAAIAGPRVVFVNGAYRPALSRIAGLANGAGIEVHPLGAMLNDAGQPLPLALRRSLEPNAERDWSRASVPALLNLAFLTDGALVSVGPDARPAWPLHLVFVSAGPAARSVSVRNIVEVGRGAKVTILESHVGVGGAAHQNNALSAVRVGDGAAVTHVAAAGGHGAAHLGTWHVAMGADAAYRGFQLTADAALVRNELFVAFEGDGGNLDLSGVFLGRGSEHIDTTLLVDHAAPHCTSRELFKGVLAGRARGVFQGKLIVRPGAQKTDGKQMAQGLMLSPDAEFDSKPELEIYADDVACGHGSTCAEIDPDLVFYLRSRGIPEAEARMLLVESFVGEAIDKVESEPVRAALMEVARGWLGRAPA